MDVYNLKRYNIYAVWTVWESSEESIFDITLENCAFIHLVNVFFCTESCSSMEQKQQVCQNSELKKNLIRRQQQWRTEFALFKAPNTLYHWYAAEW